MPDSIHFIRPYCLLLAPFGLACTWYLLNHMRRRSNWTQICDPHLAELLLINRAGDRSVLVWPGLVAMWLLTALALAGPAWEKLPQPVETPTQGQVLVFDLSRSMDSTDLPPSRLERARFKAIDLVKGQPDVQQGLVVFAGDAFVVAPLTDDIDTLLNLIPALETGTMPIQGNRSDLGLEAAAMLLDNAGFQHGRIILLTDGVSDASVKAAARAADQGYTVSVLGIGTPQGGPVPLADGSFLKDSNGNIIIPSLDEVALGAVAVAGSGHYARFSPTASDWQQLRLRSDFGAVVVGPAATDSSLPEPALVGEKWDDLGPWLVLPLLVLGAACFRRGWMMVLVLGGSVGAPGPSYAFDWQDLWYRKDQQAMQLFTQQQFADIDESAPRQWRGAARYRLDDFAAAEKSWAEFPAADATAHYNRGNALAKMNRLSEAIAAYDAAIALDSTHADAGFNKALVEQVLRQQQQQSDAEQQAEEQNSEPAEQQPADSTARPEEQQEAGADAAESEEQANAEDEKESQTARTGTPPSEDEESEQEQGESPQELTDAADNEASEQQQALEFWLRAVPDDPGGLLRRKFRYQYSQRPARENDQSW